MNDCITRRGFLARVAGSASAVYVADKTCGAHETTSSSFVVGIQSFSLRGYDVHAAIQQAGKLGFQAIELSGRHLPVDSSSAEIEQIQREATAAGLRISGHGVNRFSGDHQANRRVFDFAKRLGVANLAANPTPDAFDSLDKLVEEYGIRIAIHNHGPMGSFDKIVDTLNVVRDRHPRIGACADLGHYIRSGEDPLEAIRLLGSRLYGVHLKDYRTTTANTRESVILGRGLLNVDAVFVALANVKFPADGALSIEYESDTGEPVADVKQCLIMAQAAAQRAVHNSPEQ